MILLQQKSGDTKRGESKQISTEMKWSFPAFPGLDFAS